MRWVIVEHIVDLGIDHGAAEHRQIHIHVLCRLGVHGLDSRVSCSFGVGMLSAGAETSTSEEGVSFPVSFSRPFPQAQRESIMQTANSRQENPFHPVSPPLARPIAEQTKNARISAATMVEPTGVPARMEPPESPVPPAHRQYGADRHRPEILKKALLTDKTVTDAEISASRPRREDSSPAR